MHVIILGPTVISTFPLDGRTSQPHAHTFVHSYDFQRGAAFQRLRCLTWRQCWPASKAHTSDHDTHLGLIEEAISISVACVEPQQCQRSEPKALQGMLYLDHHIPTTHTILVERAKVQHVHQGGWTVQNHTSYFSF